MNTTADKTINISVNFSELYDLLNNTYSSPEIRLFKKDLREWFITRMGTDEEQNFKLFTEYSTTPDSRELKVCPECGNLFFESRGRVYCNDSCRKKAKNRRVAKRLREKRRVERKQRKQRDEFIERHDCRDCEYYKSCDHVECRVI